MNNYIPEDLEQMIKEIVSIKELEKLIKGHEEEFEKDRLIMEDFIEELREADKIDPELWKREIIV